MDKKNVISALFSIAVLSAAANANSDANISSGLNTREVSQEAKMTNVFVFNADKEKAKIAKLVKEIYKMKPGLVINYDTWCLFGGNCEDGVRQYFTDIGYEKVSSPKEFEQLIARLEKDNYLQEVTPNIKRTLVMLKYSIQTKTYPNPNGHMKTNIFEGI